MHKRIWLDHIPYKEVSFLDFSFRINFEAVGFCYSTSSKVLQLFWPEVWFCGFSLPSKKFSESQTKLKSDKINKTNSVICYSIQHPIHFFTEGRKNKYWAEEGIHSFSVGCPSRCEKRLRALGETHLASVFEWAIFLVWDQKHLMTLSRLPQKVRGSFTPLTFRGIPVIGRRAVFSNRPYTPSS